MTANNEKLLPTSEHCATCGARLPKGSTCQDLFGECLAHEYTDPAYGQVHFLLVACYMIQHERYSDEALKWIQQKLRTYLEQDLSNQQLRQMVVREASMTDSHGKIVRSDNAVPLPKIAWSITIADVAEHLQSPEAYCTHVRQWAHSTLEQMSAAYV